MANADSPAEPDVQVDVSVRVEEQATPSGKPAAAPDRPARRAISMRKVAYVGGGGLALLLAGLAVALPLLLRGTRSY